MTLVDPERDHLENLCGSSHILADGSGIGFMTNGQKSADKNLEVVNLIFGAVISEKFPATVAEKKIRAG